MKTLMHTESSMGLGGQELRILLEMKAFKEKGYCCVLGCQPGSHIFKRAKEMGFHIYQVRMRSSVDPLAITSFYRFIRKESVSILHTHSSLDSWVAGIAGRFAMQKAVVATRIGGSPEVVLQQQTGLLVDPNDPEQLVQALKVLIYSPDLRKTYGMNGGKLVQENFSKEHMVAQVEKVYQ